MRLNYDHLIGKKFNKLTIRKIIKKEDKPRYGKSWAECDCECGKTIALPCKRITSGNTKSCGCLQKEATSSARACNLLGKKFGRLTVIELVRKENKKKQIYWKCQCECGKTLEAIPSYNLNCGNTKSCGCLWMENINGIHYSERNEEIDIFRPMFEFIKHSNGHKKGSNLDMEYLKELWISQKETCPYTGVRLFLPGWNSNKDYLHRASLDRIDSNIGYMKGNVQFVSTMINWAKNKCSNDEVIDFCKNIAKMWKDKE